MCWTAMIAPTIESASATNAAGSGEPKRLVRVGRGAHHERRQQDERDHLGAGSQEPEPDGDVAEPAEQDERRADEDEPGRVGRRRRRAVVHGAAVRQSTTALPRSRGATPAIPSPSVRTSPRMPP